MRPLWTLIGSSVALVIGCGRLDFAPVDDAAPITIMSVTPGWAVPAGGTIDVTLSRDAAGAVLAVDGAPCSTLAITGPTITCVAPPHGPAIVELVATQFEQASAPREFVYITEGMFQLGGPLDDRTSGVAVDGLGNVIITGGTTGALDGANYGDFDAVTAKYDASGALVWVRQLGGPLYDYARDVAVDPAGEITIAGYTAGDLGGTGNAGSNDVFVARYAPNGTLAWVAQLGSTGDDQAWDLGVDAGGNTVVALQTTGALATAAGGQDYAIARFTAAGQLAWVRQDGTAADDFGHSVAVAPDGTSYLAGYTTGAVSGANAGGIDMFVARYAADGTQQWIRQRGGASDDSATDAQLDGGGQLWIVGNTTGSIDGAAFGGAQDVFVMRFDEAGAWSLTRQLGGAGSESTFGVVATLGGNVYVECNTTMAFDGEPFHGGPDDFCLLALDHDGNHLWTRIVGGPASDEASSCALDRSITGMVYLSLISQGSLDGMPNRGGNDIGVAKLDANGVLR